MSRYTQAFLIEGFTTGDCEIQDKSETRYKVECGKVYMRGAFSREWEDCHKLPSHFLGPNFREAIPLSYKYTFEFWGNPSTCMNEGTLRKFFRVEVKDISWKAFSKGHDYILERESRELIDDEE